MSTSEVVALAASARDPVVVFVGAFAFVFALAFTLALIFPPTSDSVVPSLTDRLCEAMLLFRGT